MDGKGKGERKETRKKITIIDNMIPGTLGNSLGSLLPTGYSLPPVTILGSLSFPSVHTHPIPLPPHLHATRRVGLRPVEVRGVMEEDGNRGR